MSSYWSSRRSSMSSLNLDDNKDYRGYPAFDASSDSLYAQFNQFNLSETHEARLESSILAITGPKVYELNPYDIANIVPYDSEIESKIFSSTNALHSLLYMCDEIVAGFHSFHSRPLRPLSGQYMLNEIASSSKGYRDSVSSQSSNSSSNIPSDFVTTKSTRNKARSVRFRSGQSVSQTLLNNQNQYVMTNDSMLEHFTHAKRVRILVSHSILLVRKFAKTFSKAVELIEDSSATDGTVEMTRNNIKHDLFNFESVIEEVDNLDITLSDISNSHKNRQLQDIFGADSIPLEIFDIWTQKYILERKQKESYVAIRCQQGKVAAFSTLVAATQKFLPRTHQYVEAEVNRIYLAAKLFAKIKETIKDAPVSTSSNEYLQWFYWWTNFKEKKTDSEENTNPKEDDEMHYYRSILYARQTQQSSGESNENVWKEFNDVFNTQYNKAVAQLENMNETFRKDMETYQFEIDELTKKIAAIDMPALEKISNSLQQYFTLLVYRASTEEGISALSPLAEILRGIRTLVRNDLKLLLSEDKNDIFIAANRLKKQASFLNSYSDSLMYL